MNVDYGKQFENFHTLKSKFESRHQTYEKSDVFGFRRNFVEKVKRSSVSDKDAFLVEDVISHHIDNVGRFGNEENIVRIVLRRVSMFG